jgi:hypothetical protein
MNNQNNSTAVVFVRPRESVSASAVRIHESWLTFIRYCTNLDHGEIERLKIQGGLPIMAEIIKEKIKFVR